MRGSSLASRREFLYGLGASLGAAAFQALLHTEDTGPLAAKSGHLPAKARNCIFLMMEGGPSHIDTFDPKPKLDELHLQEFIREGQMKSAMESGKRYYVQSPFRFRRAGQSGADIAENWEHLAGCVDDICFIHSMHTDIPEHAGAILMMNLGHLQPSRPSLGSWLVYGLGSENQDLPGFVAMSPRAQPRGKLANWGNAFLPGAYAGTYVNLAGIKPDAILRDLKNQYLSRAQQRRQADLLAALNQLHLEQQERDAQLEASIQTMEMAFRMQFAVPDAFDLSRESQATLDLYGDSEYAKGCLLARRLVERGVRMVQLSLSIDGYDIAWDTGHNDIQGGHARLAQACDQGIAALLKDLKQRGLLDETLVVWGGEFGRAPTSEGQKGRDHDHYGFTVWLAGGGVKTGFSYGATDAFGLTAVENRVHVHDLHATILHLMGLDHERLTYRYSGRDFRLTDVHGQVIEAVLA